MVDANLLVLIAGLLAYCIAVALGTGPLVYVVFVLDTALTTRLNEQEEIGKAKNAAIAIELGTTILCQAILCRHAVYAAMAVIRSLFVEDLSPGDTAWIVFRSGLCILVIVALALGSVRFCGYVFKKFTKKHMRIAEAIDKERNVAMAVFYALVLLAMTVVLNEGMEDFSRSLIPYGRAGIVEVP